MARFFTTFLAVVVLAQGAAAQQGQAPLPAVTVAPATMSALENSQSFNGRLVADQAVELSARVSGQLESVLFTPGDVVEEGAPLLQIDDEIYAAAVTEAEGSIKSAEATRDLNALERDRQQTLVERQASAQVTLDQAAAALGQAEGDLVRLSGTLERARLDLEYTTIKAPFKGRVGITDVDPGALVGPESGPLVRLVKLDPIFVEFPITTAMLRNFLDGIEKGEAQREASVKLVLANGSEYGLMGDIDFIDSEINQGTDTVMLRAIFENPDWTLLDGELVRVVLTAAEKTQYLTVPQQSVVRDLLGAYVLVVDGEGTVAQKRVETGLNAQGLTVITSGLEEGEMVISEGLNKARPGAKVDAAEAEMAEPAPQPEGQSGAQSEAEPSDKMEAAPEKADDTGSEPTEKQGE